MKQDRNLPNPHNNEDTGSPETGGPVFINVGKLRRPHGIDGEILLELMTDFPERLYVGKTLFIGEQHTPIKLKSVRGHGNGLLISFEGFDIREEVGKLTNAMVMVKASSLPALPEGEFYFHELIGIQVFNESGELLGRLEEVLETGANDVYLVKGDSGQEILLPAIDAVILEIDPQQKKMIVRPPDWL